MVQKWEYKKTPVELSTETMNTLGADGWENYCIVSDQYGRIETMFWKRRVD